MLTFVRTPQSRFQLPVDAAAPIIMIGPGTGLAPFRGFLQARAKLQEEGVQLGEAQLYFGCRNDDDFIYRAELERYVRDGIVTLHTAFSRKNGMPKTYVQQLIENNRTAVIQLLDDGGHLYICGDGSHMAPAVEAALANAYQFVNEANEEAARQWLQTLEEKGRFARDVWSK